ncbi:MAG TPA: ABC transporter ATP-binding protein [Clostridia bacterium]|nr:ABC transporter ATP-binding protein [Clostridia bacterium]
MKKAIDLQRYPRFFVGLLRYKAGITVANVLCNVVIFGYSAALAYCIQQVLNRLQSSVQGAALKAAAVYLAGILGASVLRSLAILACSYLDRLRSYYYQQRTRANILACLYRQEDITRATGHSGRIFEVLDDDVPACTFPAELLTEVSGYVLYTVAAVIMLLLIHWQITLFIFCPLSLSIYGVQKLSEHMKEKRKTSREAHDDVSSFLGDVTHSVQTIKAAGAEEVILAQAARNNQARRKTVLQDVLFTARTDALLKTSTSVGTVVMMFVAAAMIPSGRLKIGDFSMFVLYLHTLADCVNRIVELVYESKKAEVSYERILDAVGVVNEQRLLDDQGLSLRKPNIAKKVENPRVSLQCFEARNLSYAHAASRGIRNVSLAVRPGELVVITGEVGSGKSTLMNILAGLVKADAGQLLWNNTDMADQPVLHAPPMIVSAPQRSGFFSDDLRANICLGEAYSDEHLAAALRLSVLEDTVMGMKEGMNTQTGNRGEMLSGGQRQRLAFARLFAREAEVNLIDDNVSGLDEGTLLQLLGNLSDYVRQTRRAAIVATNHRAFVQAADRVLIMKNGRLLDTDGASD